MWVMWEYPDKWRIRRVWGSRLYRFFKISKRLPRYIRISKRPYNNKKPFEEISNERKLKRTFSWFLDRAGRYYPDHNWEYIRYRVRCKTCGLVFHNDEIIKCDEAVMQKALR